MQDYNQIRWQNLRIYYKQGQMNHDCTKRLKKPFKERKIKKTHKTKQLQILKPISALDWGRWGPVSPPSVSVSGHLRIEYIQLQLDNDPFNENNKNRTTTYSLTTIWLLVSVVFVLLGTGQLWLRPPKPYFMLLIKRIYSLKSLSQMKGVTYRDLSFVSVFICWPKWWKMAKSIMLSWVFPAMRASLKQPRMSTLERSTNLILKEKFASVKQ